MTRTTPLPGLYALLMLAGHASAPAAQPPEPLRISVSVDLVLLHATVRDRKGNFASGLRKQDFEIHEDGVRQAIRLLEHEDVPVTVGLVVDHSGSMRAKLREVIAGARTFVRYSNREDQMFVVNFNEHVTLGLPGTILFTNSADALERAISHTAATGQTALYDAVVKGLERLREGNRDKKVLIVISDGGDNASTRGMEEVLNMAGQSNAVVYAIGVFDKEDPDRNPGVLSRLSRATGGEVFFPDQLEDVVATCERIARDIRNQYTLGYVSSNATRSGVYRAIRVVARDDRGRKLDVRTRSGYIAAGEAK